MNNKAILSALMSACLTLSTSAFAQNDHRGNDGNDRNEQVKHGQNHKGKKNRGAGPKHDMHKGGRLSNEYRGNKYVVNDWRGRHLSAPPRGSHWVQTGGDYVLVAIASGVIAQVLLNN